MSVVGERGFTYCLEGFDILEMMFAENGCICMVILMRDVGIV